MSYNMQSIRLQVDFAKIIIVWLWSCNKGMKQELANKGFYFDSVALNKAEEVERVCLYVRGSH